MRFLLTPMIAVGSAFGVLATATVPALGAGGFSLPSSPASIVAERQVHPDLVLVQSRQQRRDIDDFLELNEFADPNFVRKDAPRYFVEACRRDTKYLLMFTREGEYFGSRKLGECLAKPKAVSLRELRFWLEDRNYTEIRFTDDTPPTRTAEACLNNRHYSISFDAAGKGTPSRKWFSNACRAKTDDRPPVTGNTLSRNDARLALRRSGYTDVRFDRNFTESKLVEACQGVRKFRLFLNSKGQTDARRAVGFCEQNIKKADNRPSRPDDALLENRRTRLKPAECQLVLNWLQYRNPIMFESASDEISRESRTTLETISDNVDRCSDVRLSIEGHTDSIGPARFNRRLSEQRADAVRRYLVDRGVSRRRLSVEGYGEAYPVTENLIERDRARNRRIDLVLEWGNAKDLGLNQTSRN